MKKRILFLLLTLCLILSVFTLASCGKKDKKGGGEQTTAATTDKWEILAPRITMLPEDFRQLKIEYSAYKSAGSKTSKNDVYLKGPDTIEAVGTPAIQIMVYERNRAAEATLGTTVEFVSWDYAWGKQAGQIDLVVKGNDPDAPDLFVNMIYDLNMELLNSSFKDVWSIPGSFFDFSTPGWQSVWMNNMSLTGDRAYVLGSDYFLDIMRVMTILPFNMDMMDKNAAKLGPVILNEGESLGPGEKLSAYFIDFVEKGNWTWDVLGKFCEAIWHDENGDGQDSIQDILGIIADENQGFSAGAFVYSCGETLVEEYKINDPNSAYYGKQWIKYADDSAGLNQIFDKVKAVFDGHGSLSTSKDYSPSSNTPEKPGLAYHHTKFAKSEILFGGVCLLGTLEDATFQNMTDLYSVLPCPKVDASKSYNTIIYNTGDAGAINVRTQPGKAKVLTAYLQYCTERSVPIREEFLQIVTKHKTTTYNQGTDRMLELIYDGILYGRDKAIDDLIGDQARSGGRWHSMMKINHFSVGADFIASEYKSLRAAKQSLLDECLRTWYTLPKVEPDAE